MSSPSCWQPPAASGNRSRSSQAAPRQLWPPAQASPSGLWLQFSLPCRKQEYPTGAEGKLWPRAAPGRPRRARAASGAAGGGPAAPGRNLAFSPAALCNCPRPRSKVPPPRRRPKVTSGGDQPRLSAPATTVMNTLACLPRVLRSSFARKSRRFVLPDPYGTPSARCKPRSCTLLQYFPSTGEVSDLHYELYTEFMTPTQLASTMSSRAPPSTASTKFQR